MQQLAVFLLLFALRELCIASEVCRQNQDIVFLCGAGANHPCVPLSWVCDGVNDCDDGSDETFCYGCDPAEWFQCEIDHLCIAKEWVGDGTNDCSDGSDEYVSRYGGCSQGKFYCGSGECISNLSLCDGDRDCSDNSDELSPLCSTSGTYSRPSVSTISASIKTQGQTSMQCAGDEFQCYDGIKCLPRSFRCDKIAQCHDSSDEADCADVSNCPPKVQFSTNKNCIRWAQHCNAVEDCGDNSNEFNCDQIRPTWHECEGMFRCNSGKCITLKRVCDNKDHCGDASDEPPSCGVRDCSSDDACPGNQQCLDLPTQGMCVCPRGFQMTATGCEDINECQQYGSCSQYCENTNGSFSCSCTHGFTLKSDKVTCGANDVKAELLYAHGQEVRLMNLMTGTYTKLVQNRLSIVPVAYNFKEGMAYFGDYQGHQIAKVPVNNSRLPVTILRGYHGAREPDGLAIDWINDWIYWSSPHSRTISMAKLDGSYQQVIVNETRKLDEPRGVAVDPLKGYLFWTDWGDHSHIGRAAMDGSGQQHIVVNDVVWPNGIAVDTIIQCVYWVDGKLGTVVVADYYGRNKKVLIKGGIGRPLFIALFENKIYVSSEWGLRKVGRVFVVSQMNGSHLTTLEKDMDSVQGIAVYQSRQQSPGKNPCNGAPCSDHCVASFISFTDYKCICQERTRLLNDEHTCENKATRCSDSYCNNNGQCVVKDGNQSCLCDMRHEGSRCERLITGVTRCPDSGCNDHGKCYVSISVRNCECAVGYTGVRCEVETHCTPPTGPVTTTVNATVRRISGGNSAAVAAGVAIGCITVVAVVVIIIIIIRNKNSKKLVNFSNPMYTSDSDAVVITQKSETYTANDGKGTGGLPPPTLV